jgi:hypothetical protein
MSDENRTTKIKVAALWKNVKDGNEYFSGNWGGARILIFPNGYKERDDQPDFYMYLAPRPPPSMPQGRDEPTSGGHEQQPV